jgi:tetratricopeptide (TPR) repeat protein
MDASSGPPFLSARTRRFVCVAVALVAFIAFANTLGYALVYDDKLILASPAIRDPWNLRAIFTSDFYDSPRGNLGLFRPLTNLSFVLSYELDRWITGDGANALGSHAATVMCHVVASVLFYVWLERAGISSAIAATAALWFAAHPIHSEAVANVSGRSEPLAAAFGFAFLIAYRERRPLWAALGFMCALASKESAIAFLPIALLADAFLAPGDARPRAASLAACAIALALWFALRAMALHGPASPIAFIDNPLVRVSPFVRVITAAKVQLLYLRLLVVPLGLSTDYSFDHVHLAHSVFDPSVAAAFAAALLAAFVAVRARRRAPVVAFAIASYAACWLATGNFFFPIGTLMAERLAYAPSIFACLFASAAAWHLAPRIGERALRVVVGLITAGGIALTLAQNRVWRDEDTLYRDQVRSAPDSAKAHLNLAFQRSSSGDLAGEKAELESALEIAPDYAWSWYFLGDAHERANEHERAIGAWKRALELDPGLSVARASLIGALLAVHRRDDACAQMSELLARDAAHPAARMLLEKLFAASSASERAAAHAQFENGRELARRGDSTAAGELQHAFRTFALDAADRRACLAALCDALRAANKPKLEAAWRELARALE